MGRKNHLGHEREAARKALVELLNLPNINFRKVDDDKRRAPAFALAQRFVETNGPLRGGDPLWAEAETFEYAQRLRQVWVDAEESRFRAAEATLNEIFKASDPLQKETSGFTADIQAKTIRTEPTTLLHRLALELLYSRKSLRRCRECRDFFFVKNPSVRRQYCQNPLRDCFRSHRNRYSKQGMRTLRDKRKGQANAKRSNRQD